MKQPLPRGILMPIGGGEDKKDRKEVLTRLLKETGRRDPRICVVTLATNLPEEVAKDYLSAFKDLNCEDVKIIHYETRQEADSDENLEKIKWCDAVLFSGGNQLKISSLMGGTELLELIKERYFEDRDFIIAGTSAGAAAMSDTMIVAGSSQDSLIKGQLELTNGLGFITGVFIDTHFTERGRFGRLIQTVTSNPGVLGLGLGEDTSVVIYDNLEMEVVGSGLVVIADGNDISYTDLHDVPNGEPITVEGIRMHILGPGQRFLLDERRVLARRRKAA